MKKSCFFSKVRRSKASDGARPSRLRLETLEERQLLSVGDVAALILADATSSDAQYATATNAVDSIVDVSSTLNTTATRDGSNVSLTENDVINWVNGSGVGLEGFNFSGTVLAENAVAHATYVQKLYINAVPDGVSSITLDKGSTNRGFNSTGELYANNLGLSGLNITALSSLATLECHHNQLTELDLSGNIRLSSVACSHNDLASLDLSGNANLSILTLDYDVERIFVYRQPASSTKHVYLTLADVPEGATVQVIHSDPEGAGNGIVSPVSQNAFQYDLIGSASSDTGYLTHRDSIHVMVNGELKMAVNPLFKLHTNAGSVSAVIDVGANLSDVDLFKAVRTENVEGSNSTVINETPVAPSDFSFAITGGGLESAITGDDAKEYFEIAGDATDGYWLKYKKDLAPDANAYTIAVTAATNEGTSGMAIESFSYSLTVNQAALATPDNFTATPDMNSATLTWRGVEYAGEYVIERDGIAVGSIVADDSQYITGEDPETGRKLYSYPVAGLNANTEYAFTVSAVRTFMSNSYPAAETSFITLSPEIAVTVASDEFDHSDDFDSSGNPYRISLREAYDYVNRYFVGTSASDASDFSNWVLIENESSIRFEDGQHVYADSSNNDRRVFKTIEFQLPDGTTDVYVEDEPIASEKSFTIVGNGLAVNGVDPTRASDSVYVAEHGTRIFEINAGTITAEDVNLTNGYAQESAEHSGRGGAIYIAEGGQYVAEGGSIYDNKADGYGGAVCVEFGGNFTATEVAFSGNKAVRGGAIWNRGTVVINGESSFVGNIAEANSNGGVSTNGAFGGAIYNGGSAVLTLDSGSSSVAILFQGNQATGDDPVVVEDILKGYSGGAIYNAGAGEIFATNVDFDGNFAGKYGGAVSNFADFEATNVNFTDNVASTGGALQNSGNAKLTNAYFNGNKAIANNYLIADSDFGGNGGAIFASRTVGVNGTGSIEFYGYANFLSNGATNAGGAIDFVSGSMAFNGAQVTIESNSAATIGGGMVVAEGVDIDVDSNVEDASAFSIERNDNDVVVYTATDDPFHDAISPGAAGYYAPNVAIACDVGDSAINAITNAFFPTQSGEDAPGRDKIALFARYASTAVAEVGFEELAASFTSSPTIIYAKIGDGEFVAMSANGSQPNTVGTLSLTPGEVNVVRYYEAGHPDILYRANINVFDDGETSVIVSQFDMNGLSVSGTGCPVGVSIRIYSEANEPVSSWTLDWGDGEDSTISSYGFECRAYHFYNDAGAYDLSLLTDLGGPYDLGVVTAKSTDASDAIFEDLDLVDGFFED